MDSVTKEIFHFQSRSKELGLNLNYSKCEVIGLSLTTTERWNETPYNFIPVNPQMATLLGAPIGRGGVDKAIASQCATLQTARRRLSFLSSHEALYLLKHSLSIPKLQYLLRTAPCFLSGELQEYDYILSNAVMSITNTSLDATALSQAALPVRWGGLGIRSAITVAPSAFISSLLSSETMICQLLPQRAMPYRDPLADEAISKWRQLGGSSIPTGSESFLLRSWDNELCSATATSISTIGNAKTVARLIACRGQGSGSMVHGYMPCPQ